MEVGCPAEISHFFQDCTTLLVLFITTCTQVYIAKSTKDPWFRSTIIFLDIITTEA
jgi:hypothetical protein